jgi:hypothetical protein
VVTAGDVVENDVQAPIGERQAERQPHVPASPDEYDVRPAPRQTEE